jgi:integrase
VLDRNVLLRFKQYEATETRPGRRVNRGAFTEEEVQKLLAAGRPHERALIGLLCFTGLRPSEAYALRNRDVVPTAGAATIARTAPKTAAANRTVALSGWLVKELEAHRPRTGAAPDNLIFATATGVPMNPSNVRLDI